jgi:hypothetical protein
MRKVSRANWGKEHDRCMVCGKQDTELAFALTTHEIVRGCNRAKGVVHPACWLRACIPCHCDVLDGMPVVKQLAIKAIHDEECYDLVAVNRSRGRADGAITQAQVDAAMVETEKESA